MNNKWFKWISGITVALFMAYFLFFKVQTYLGEQALEATGINRLSLSDALIQAKQENRYILADMSAIWCPSCRQLDKKIFSNQQVKDVISKHYVFTRIEYETDEGKVFMKKYNIKGFPTLLILDQDANKIRQLPLSFDPEVFIEYLLDFIELNALS